MTARSSLRNRSWFGKPEWGMPVAITAAASSARAATLMRLSLRIGALALLRGEGLVVRRVVDEPGDELAVALERDGDGEDGNAVQKVGGAVEGIDDPAMGGIGAFDLAALLHEEAVAGTRPGQFGEDDLLGAMIGGADEIRRDLSATLEAAPPRRNRARGCDPLCGRRRA